jgi:hypothetical protein
MKNTILKITALGLFAAAIIATPIASHAQDATTPAAATTAKKAKKTAAVAYTGKVSAVDTNAMTLTVGKHTLDINSETKITKNGQPATLADATVGETATGSYKKGTDGKLTATTVDYSTKVAKKKKAAASTTSTNSVSQ